MLDNMDGITATVSIGIIVNTIYRILHNGDITSMHLLVLIGVLASLIAFLRFNWHPSKMYMGDYRQSVPRRVPGSNGNYLFLE
jgi:UDP-GlcNAc:undecaprenyl-phosphate GlcNAc-1-phosphate transferase